MDRRCDCRAGLFGQHSSSIWFWFGDEQAGWVQVTPATAYTRELGYGFDFGSSVQSIDRGGRDALRGDFYTADKPFFFSVKLVEGNYRVRVILGDKQVESTATIRAESRRLMVEKVQTGSGKFKTVEFLVNVRDSLIHSGGTVRLKPRERTGLNWDEKLTLEFNNARPCVCAVEMESVTDAVTVSLAGNSTVVDQDRESWATWDYKGSFGILDRDGKPVESLIHVLLSGVKNR